jgi:hypothetical protein
MPRSKKSSAVQYEKVLQILVTNPPDGPAGRIVPVAEIQEVLNGVIPLNLLSKFICYIKHQNHAGIPVRSIRDGRRVIAYQLPFVDMGIDYLSKRGMYIHVPKAVPKEILKNEVTADEVE